MVKLLTDSSLLGLNFQDLRLVLQAASATASGPNSCNRNRLTASHRRCAGAIFKSDLLGIIVGILMSFASSFHSLQRVKCIDQVSVKAITCSDSAMIVEIDLKFCFKPSSASLSGEIDLASQFFDSRFSLGPLPYFNGLGLQGLLPQISITSNYNVSTPNSYRLDVYIRSSGLNVSTPPDTSTNLSLNPMPALKKLEDLLPSKLPQYEFSWLFKSAATYTTEFQLVQTNVSLIPNVATLKFFRLTICNDAELLSYIQQVFNPAQTDSNSVATSTSNFVLGPRHDPCLTIIGRNQRLSPVCLASKLLLLQNTTLEFSPAPNLVSSSISALTPTMTFNPSTPTDLTDIPPKFWLDWTAEIIGNLGGRLTVSFYFKCIVAKSHFNRTTSSTSYRLAHINVIQPSVSSPRSYLQSSLSSTLINLFSTALDYCCIWQEMYTGTTAQFKKVKVQFHSVSSILIQCSKIAWGIKDTSSMERGA
ncbi:hypothetical protein C8F04DRAFT_1202262 [Mycena alexandri]|uniref:Uncharacterized protein n=1 Tax=Mycena alexandri TaxID=1745969 RepID=A0AAD6WM80_9AGAR|nr:hypothetical protein C8F04DRAFT_1202262 [Mycena alexandri]